MKKEANAPDLPETEFLYNALVAYGMGGTSSDESDAETPYSHAVKPSRLPWRRLPVGWLDHMDPVRSTDELGRGTGPRPFLRARSPSARTSTRPPVPGLAIEYYDPDWLESQSEGYIAEVLKPDMAANIEWFELPRAL